MRHPPLLNLLVGLSILSGAAALPLELGTAQARGLGILRWMASDNVSIPFADIEGNGEAVSIFWTLNQPRLAEVQFETGQQAWASNLPQKVSGAIDVAAHTGRVVIAYGDFFSGLPVHVAAFGTTSATPLWVERIGLSLFGAKSSPLAISADGMTVAFAYRLTGTGSKHLSVFHGDTGELRWTLALPGPASSRVNGVDISDSGDRIMVGLGDRSMIFSTEGAVLAEFIGSTCCDAPSLSSDGLSAIIRFGGPLELVRWDGSAYATAWRGDVSPLYVSMQALSPEGNVVAAYGSSLFCQSNRLFIFRPPSTAPYSTYDAYGADACPSSIDFSRDGHRVVVGTQGTIENREEPADFLRDVATVLDTQTPVVALPLFRLLDDVDEKGSATKVGLSDDGKRVVVSTKKVHEQVLGNGGRVWGIELLV